jgi:predicted 3-demethylubiquinone-9 3-methyltransferase (glyoxalase superfamily)
MTKVTPFLWYDDKALEAAQFYTDLIPNSELKEVNRSPVSGEVFSLTFSVAGQDFYALNGGPHFEFTPATSLFVACDDQTEVDKYWNAFIENGGEESRCGWLKDRWGLSWQIVPKRLGEVLSHPDPVKAKAAMDAMLQMKRIIIADLNAAVGE